MKSNRGGRRSETTAVTRERVLDVALRRFRAGGYAAVSLRGVAVELGLTAPALYRHFEDKADLVAAVLEHGFSDLRARFADVLTEGTARDRLRATLKALLDFGLAEPRVYQTLAYPADERAVRAVVRRLHRPARIAFRFLADRVCECMDEGLVHPGDPEQVALVLWSHSHGLLSMYLSAHLDVEEEEFRRLYWECSDAVGRGLLLAHAGASE